MEALTILFLCFCAGATNGSSKIKVELEGDRPFLRVALSLDAYLKCCYKATDVSLDVSWVVTPPNKNRKDSKTMNVTVNNSTANGVMCHSLILQNVNMIDTGFYQCVLNGSYLKEAVWTHGTYLQVYRKVAKTLDISEGAKNSILTAEGVFLMLGVIFPGCMMLCKSNKSIEQKNRKLKEENIYEGLNLEECCSAYDQVQRSLVHEPYQDVGNMIPEEEEEEEIQLENP
ncbi:B-cell antigen receptor complex-associated protein alpha chain isoform X1 [Esox lucius]|uniref:B-cell antigen receptor complex-associated protein alpha chain isoform X1 n=1 Tax=Esox lucius TaxID=8010 RepID=UPI0005777CC0|nr:B-cell antigen receptor complex-associated protein alpha chain isoform X1 [Esox lucius]